MMLISKNKRIGYFRKIMMLNPKDRQFCQFRRKKTSVPLIPKDS